MAETGFKGRLEDEVRRRVKRIVGGRIIQSTANAGTAQSEVQGIAASREGCLRILQRCSQPDVIVEVLGHAEPVLPRPAETNVVLGIDGHGQDFGAVVDALLSLGNQAPHLTPGETPSIAQGSLTPNLPLAEAVAVALVVVGSYASRKKVSFHVTGKLGVVEFAFSEQGDSRLPAGAKEFRNRVLTASRH